MPIESLMTKYCAPHLCNIVNRKVFWYRLRDPPKLPSGDICKFLYPLGEDVILVPTSSLLFKKKFAWT